MRINDPVTVGQIATRLKVSTAAVSNWRARHDDFPRERIPTIFEWSQVKTWADRHQLPKPAPNLGNGAASRLRRAQGVIDELRNLSNAGLVIDHAEHLTAVERAHGNGRAVAYATAADLLETALSDY